MVKKGGKERKNGRKEERRERKKGERGRKKRRERKKGEREKDIKVTKRSKFSNSTHNYLNLYYFETF